MSQPDWMKDAPAWVREGRELNEAEWLAGPHLIYMVSFLLHRYLDRPGEDRRHLLFGCACCRFAWDLLQLDAAKRLVELAERHADGEVSEAEFRAANSPTNFSEFDLQCRGQAPPGLQLSACALSTIRGARWLAEENFRKSHGAYGVAQETCADRTTDYIPTPQHPFGRGYGVGPDRAQLAKRVGVLRDIFGNPFRPVAASPKWRSDAVLSLARGMYGSREFSAMPMLAGALQDAGCDSAEVLDHCRNPGPHVRGCWVIDLVLGKE